MNGSNEMKMTVEINDYKPLSNKGKKVESKKVSGRDSLAKDIHKN